MAKAKIFWDKNKKPLTIVIACVLSVLFIGSIVLAIFIGGEFKTETQVAEVKGLVKFTEEGFSTTYINGDKFDFGGENTKVQLIAKDPAKEDIVNIPELPSSEYGFLVNGEGEMINDPSTITMDFDVEFISVVSKEYPTLSCKIPVTVVGADKCLMHIVGGKYETNYYAGGKFDFDKESSELHVITEEDGKYFSVKQLKPSDYGFRVNGSGDVIDNASDIRLDKTVESIDVVYKNDVSLKKSVSVRVLGEGEKPVCKELVLEAESPYTNLYKSNEFIEYGDRGNFIRTDGSLMADSGFSGRAVLYGFGKNKMKVEFVFECTEDTEVDLTVMYCLRKDGKTFGSYFTVKVNGEVAQDIADQKTEVGSDYFTTAQLAPVKISLKAGTNYITFENKNNPVNFDGIKLVADKAVLVEPMQAQGEE